MMDFNSSKSFSASLQALLDKAIQQGHAQQAKRHYLGASRLGVDCERMLQYEYQHTPVDEDKLFSGRILRVFERGHRLEDAMSGWLTQAGFTLITHDSQGKQMGFEALDGRLQGHVDGLIVQAPDGIIDTPCLWENKALKNSSFNALKKHKLAVAHPVYAAQMAVYQAYMGWHHNPALFTAINSDTMEVYAERVVFDAPLAQRMSDRAVKVITATQAGETLPRSTASKEHFTCNLCAYQQRCWGGTS